MAVNSRPFFAICIQFFQYKKATKTAIDVISEPLTPRTNVINTHSYKFQLMFNIDPAVCTQCPVLQEPTRQAQKEDQLTMSDEAGSHLEAIIFDILMQGGGNSCCFTNILKLLGSISLIKFADVKKKMQFSIEDKNAPTSFPFTEHNVTFLTISNCGTVLFSKGLSGLINQNFKRKIKAAVSH